MSELTVTRIATFQEPAYVATWLGLKPSACAAPLEVPGLLVKSVQFDGVWGSGGEIILEGSIDGERYFPLHTPSGEDVRAVYPALIAVAECCRFIRPRILKGDATTAIDTLLLAGRLR